LEHTVRGAILTTFGKLLESIKRNIPDPRVLPIDEELYMSYVFVGDEAFALSQRVLRPYSNKYLICLQCITAGCQEHEEQLNEREEFWLINGEYSIGQPM